MIAAMVAGVVAFGAEAGAEVSAGPVMSGSVAPSVVPLVTPPTDLHPRPLGPARGNEAAAGMGIKGGEKKDGAAGAAPKSAVATLWDNPTIRTGGSLLVVLLLIFLLATVAKKVAGKSGSLAAALGAGGKAPAGLLEVLGRYPLSRGQTLILLKVDRRVLLLAQTTPRMRGGVGTLTTLCEMTDAEDVASILMKAEEHEGNGANAKFGALLKQFDRTHARSGGVGAGEDDGIEVDLRSVRETEQGDRAELWDESAAANTPQITRAHQSPVVHKFPNPIPAPAFAPQARAAEAYASVGGMGASGATGTESFGSIRERLHALRGEAHR